MILNAALLFIIFSLLFSSSQTSLKNQGTAKGGPGAQGVPSETGRKRISVWVLGVLLSCLSLQALLRSQSPESYPYHSRHLWDIAPKPGMSGSREMKRRGRRLSINALWAKWENRSILCSDLKTCFSSMHGLWSFLLLRSFQRDAGLGDEASPHLGKSMRLKLPPVEAIQEIVPSKQPAAGSLLEQLLPPPIIWQPLYDKGKVNWTCIQRTFLQNVFAAWDPFNQVCTVDREKKFSPLTSLPFD